MVGTVVLLAVLLVVGFVMFIAESEGGCGHDCNQGRNCCCGINRQSKEK